MRWVIAVPFLLLAGCASTHENDVLPGISSSLTLGDLDEQQRTTLCEWSLEVWGSTDGTPVTLECGNGGLYTASDLATCVDDLTRLAGACDRLVVRDVEFREDVAAHCHDEGFVPYSPGPC